ncbi:MAG: Piwi domain-containing protein [Candidatus Nezhaarchaeales archaeon]
MRKGGYLKRPVLKFRDGTALTPIEGFKLNFKPYRGAKSISCYVICKGNVLHAAKEMIYNLIYGVKGYEGLEAWFDCSLNVHSIVKVDANDEYVKVANEVSEDHDIVVAFIPDEMAVEYEEDPYMPLKRILAAKGLPSQMIEESTCRHLRDNSYVLFNVALSLYSKTGGIPWTLSEPLYFDCVIGLDSMNKGVAATVAYATPLSFNWFIESGGREALTEAVISCLKEAKTYKPIRRIAFHKDGPLHESEVEALKAALNRAEEIGLVHDPLWCAFEVKSRFTPRILGTSALRFYNPEKGVYVQLDKFKAIVATTGFPERPLSPAQSPVRPIMVEAVDGSWWDFDFERALTDVYWLSELHWASGFTSTRLPITTLYAKRICSFWRAGVEPSKQLYGKLWFL